MGKKLKTGVFSRGSQLLSMATQLAGHEFKRSVKTRLDRLSEDSELARTRIEQAEILVQNLSQLKGAAMKAGQLLSLDSSDLLPEQARKVLSQLQAQTESLDYDQIEDILIQELGHETVENLQPISKRAEAAASIGQVHSALWNGEKLALKVQYPGVSDSIDSDLSMLKRICETSLSVYGKRVDLSNTFEEFKQVLKQESDYHVELSHLKTFYNLFENDSRFVVPKPYPELSTKKVLAMQWIEAQSLEDWFATRPSLEERLFIAETLLDLYCHEFYLWGLVQTDPNYGNFLILKDPLKIVLLDFGATLSYDLEFRKSYVALLKTIRTHNQKKIIKAAEELNMIDPRESNEAKDLFYKMMLQSVAPFEQHNQPFVFTDKDFEHRARDIGLQFSRALKYSPPPRKLLFLHRKLGGLFNLLRKLDVTMDLRPLWEKSMALADKAQSQDISL